MSQEQYSWCWAANLEFIAQASPFLCATSQCAIAEDYNYYLIDCCYSYHAFCDSAPNAYMLRDYMLRAGFDLMPGAYGQTVLGALGAVKTRDLVCGNWDLVLCAFEPSSATGPLVYGHAGTIRGVNDTEPDTLQWLYDVMDPARPDLGYVVYTLLRNGAFPGGEWRKTMIVRDVDCSQVSIGDISGFGYDSQDYNYVRLGVGFSHTADPADSMAFYVADNPWGPLRRLWTKKPLSQPPPAQGIVLTFRDERRYPRGADYYYYLDHGPGRFPDVRRPDNTVLANHDNPIHRNSYFGYEPRDTLDAPDILAVNDVTPDDGGAVLVTWSPSDDQALIDQYNIYRRESVGGYTGEYSWAVSLPASATSFLDTMLVNGVTYTYMVSSAHHGYETWHLSDNLGIWNDFSAPVSGVPVDNLASASLSLDCPDTISVCPAGDYDTLSVLVNIKGSDGLPTVAVPPSMIAMHVLGDTLYSCDGETSAPGGPTDATGTAPFSASALGGRDELLCYAEAVGAYMSSDTVRTVLRGPDENWDGEVNIVDMGLFLLTYPSPPKPYVYYRDYDGDSLVDIADVGLFTTHWWHGCPAQGGGSVAARGESVPTEEVAVSYFEEVRSPRERYLYVRISMADPRPCAAAALPVAADNPNLEFIEFQPAAEARTAVAVPVTRNGNREVFIAMLDFVPSGSQANLGQLVFRARGGGEITLAPGDLTIRDGEFLSDGRRSRTSSSTGAELAPAIEHVYRNALDQNYPNPFNPATTISYTIAGRSHVTLDIYDVAGRLVRRLVDAPRTPGIYHETWDGLDGGGHRVASGVYLYRLRAADFEATRKMVVIR